METGSGRRRGDEFIDDERDVGSEGVADDEVDEEEEEEDCSSYEDEAESTGCGSCSCIEFELNTGLP